MCQLSLRAVVLERGEERKKKINCIKGPMTGLELEKFLVQEFVFCTDLGAKNESVLKTSFHPQKSGYMQLESDTGVQINLGALEVTENKRQALNSAFCFNTDNLF